MRHPPLKPGDRVQVRFNREWFAATFNRLASSRGTAWRDVNRKVYFCEIVSKPTWGPLPFVRRDVRLPHERKEIIK